jgi:hypothetical protein
MRHRRTRVILDRAPRRRVCPSAVETVAARETLGRIAVAGYGRLLECMADPECYFPTTGKLNERRLAVEMCTTPATARRLLAEIREMVLHDGH